MGQTKLASANPANQAPQQKAAEQQQQSSENMTGRITALGKRMKKTTQSSWAREGCVGSSRRRQPRPRARRLGERVTSLVRPHFSRVYIHAWNKVMLRLGQLSSLLLFLLDSRNIQLRCVTRAWYLAFFSPNVFSDAPCSFPSAPALSRLSRSSDYSLLIVAPSTAACLTCNSRLPFFRRRSQPMKKVNEGVGAAR